ncbi:hypothetical protein [Chryseobacterium hagamense]|uniref:Uncharacterized protein n=1 Tax=Chryseobacterium hagamense TaxID=395935 RepID=A0A511YM80_9FLAO|nr:hypothetical protein [Chryseobacterium hagamense]GEN76256.1 hypothetical protein CHA01nite_19960 [Chryseobacterium hagamense]
MKFFFILIALLFISCESKIENKECKIDFKISKNMIKTKGIMTSLEFQKNILQISISNFRNDTLHFATPHLIFSKKIAHQNDESGVVIKPFVPNIITDRVVAYHITKSNKKEVISIDSSKTRDKRQYEFKLAPKERYIVEYILNCEESDPEKYELVFFDSNRFDNSNYERIKYPKNGFITVKNKKYGK